MLGGGEAKIAAQHAAGEAHRARAGGAAHRRGHVRGARPPRAAALLPARDGRPRSPRRRRHHGLWQGQRPPGRGRRLRLHGDGGLDGHDRRAEGHPAARAGADRANPAGVAAGLRRRAHPGGRRVAVRRLGASVPRGGRHERGRPAGGGADGAVRGGDRVHPGAGRFRTDGQGPRLDGAGRPASGARRGRRGRHPGGARRLARALPQVGRRRSRGGRRSGLHRADQALPELLPAALRAAAAAARHQRSGRPRRRGAARRPARSPTASRTTCTR